MIARRPASTMSDPKGRMRLAPGVLGAMAAVVGLFASREASGADNDAAALALRKDAIYDDYLATRFADAETKLLKALSMCDGASDCEVTTRARLHCDLGVIEFALDNPKEGRQHFASAVHKDPKVTIGHDLSTPELEKELAAAKTAAGAPPPSSASDDSAAGEAAPSSEPVDCPPGFPGCKESQAKDAQTKDEPAEGPEPVDLPFKRNWFSLGFQVDALLLPSANNACAGGTGYTCFGSSYYAGRPLAGADDVVNGGVKIGTMRVLLGYDRALTANFTVGASLGYAFNGGPQRPGGRAFEPIDAEARASFWFGHAPLARAGFRFFVTGAVGMAEVDASIPVDIYPTAAAYQAGQSQDYAAWKKTGLGFVALGLGAMYALTPSSGIVLQLRGQQMFPTTGAGAALQLGYSMGF
jgi:hypothetical protein